MSTKIFSTPWKENITALYRENTIDENTLIACLTEDEYQIARIPHTGRAIDLGAYIGGASLALRSRGFDVISVEMLPENQVLLTQNLTLNHFPVRLYRAAITATAGEELSAYYESRSASTYNGSLLNRKENGHTVPVNTISLPMIFTDNSIPNCVFLKVDIEGAEWEIFRTLPEEYLDRIDRIAIELHRHGGKTSTTEFLSLLKGKFDDVSSEYFPQWCADGEFVHGYYMRKGA